MTFKEATRRALAFGHCCRHGQTRRGVLFVAVTALLVLALAGCSGDDGGSMAGSEESAAMDVEEAVEADGEEVEVEAAAEEMTLADGFIEAYNVVAETPITDVAEVDVTDKESGHYRTEFRLRAFDDSVSRTGLVGEDVIDIVTYDYYHEDDIRIYFTTEDADLLREVIRTAAPILDETLADEEIEEKLETSIEYLTSHL